MSLFRRNKTQEPATPEQLQDYYQTENRERVWVAWALGFATLIVTVLVVMGLFFGGRWTYRKFRPQNQPVAVTNVAQDASPQTPDSTPQTSGSSPVGSTSAPAPTSTPTNTTPTTQKSTSNLPSTGPGDTVAIFILVTIIAYIAHRRFLATR